MGRLLGLVILTILSIVLSSDLHAAQTGATMPSKQFSSKTGPLPTPDMSGLDEYSRQIAFASRNIEEGDWSMAMHNLHNAAKHRTDDPLLYEMYGIVYDSDREPNKAFENFKKAADMYYSSGNIDKAWRMLGWMRTFNIAEKDVEHFEQKLRNQ